jgi:hypothetical protein
MQADGTRVGNIEQVVKLEAAGVADPWELFPVLEQVLMEQLPRFGSGEFTRGDYSLAHEDSNYDEPTLELARASAEAVTTRLRWISLSFSEDTSPERVPPDMKEEKGQDAATFAERLAAQRAWRSARNRSVRLAVYMGPFGERGTWANLNVQGSNTNEVRGFAETVGTVMRNRVTALAAGEQVPVRRETQDVVKMRPETSSANPASLSASRGHVTTQGAKPAWYADAWRIASTHPLYSALIATVIGGLIVAIIVAAITG